MPIIPAALSKFKYSPNFMLKQFEHQDGSNNSAGSTFDVVTANSNSKTPASATPATATATTTTTTTRPTVSFAETVTIRRTISCDQYSPSERTACWYTEEEARRMKTERRATIKLMEKVQQSQKGTNNTSPACYNFQSVDDGIHHCTRGLEHKTRAGSRLRQFNQIDAAMAVMDEQEAACCGGNIEELVTRLSRAYISCNLHCQAVALEKGLRDHMVVLDQYDLTESVIQRCTRTTERRSSNAAA